MSNTLPHRNIVTSPEFYLIEGAAEKRKFNNKLLDNYKALGFINDKSRQKLCFLPRKNTLLFGMRDSEYLVGICALNKVVDQQSVYFKLIPSLRDVQPDGVFEFNNVILDKPYRGGVTLPRMLYHLIQEAISRDAQYVVGTVRYEVLRYFVSIGAIPVDHPPLHILEDSQHDDFVVYFDCSRPAEVSYIHKYMQGLLSREQVMSNIRLGHRSRKRQVLQA